MTDAQLAGFEAALVGAGQPKTTPIAQAQVVYNTVATQSAGGAAQLTAGAAQMTGLATQTGDKEVDVIQIGTGYTPRTGTFPDGAKSRADMPAMLSIGASYPVTSKLTASLGFNYYFDKNADYGKKDTLGAYVTNESVIDKNYYELALGLEYNITDKFMVSAGLLHSQTGVMKSYQTDLSYSLTSNTVGFGGQYKITPGIGLNLGALITMYNKDDKTFNHKLGTAYIPTTEVYEKSNWVLSVGLDIKIGK